MSLTLFTVDSSITGMLYRIAILNGPALQVREIPSSSIYFSLCLDETPLVTFSKDSKSRNGTVVKGTSETYKATDLCYLNGVFIDPGYIHDVLLTGLEPSTTYYYSCGMESVSCYNSCVQTALHYIKVSVITVGILHG